MDERLKTSPDGSDLFAVRELEVRFRPATIGRRRTGLVTGLLALSDVAAIACAFFLGWVVHGGRAGMLAVLALVATLPLWLASLKSAGMYDREHAAIGHSTLDELGTLFRIATIGSWLLLVSAWAIGHAESLGQIVTFWVTLMLALPLFRGAVRPSIRSTSSYPQNTVIVGAGQVGQLVARKILVHPEYRINLVGFVDAMPRERRDDLEELTILGTPDDLLTLVSEFDVERVIIAFSNESSEDTMNLVRLLKDHDVHISIIPRLFDVIPPTATSDTIEGIPVLTLPPLRLSRWSRALKRTMDLIISAAATLFLAPTFLLVAILIRIDSPGPVMFRQVRVGAGGDPFRIYKFRTMLMDADARKSEVAHLNIHAAPGGDPRMFKINQDPRVTRVGRLLRRFSLDEFPQLLNVVKGEMSLIGPRPLILEEDQHVADWGRKRLALKPGMTGLWQVSGRNRIPFDDMVKLDYMYVYSWSLARDLQLLLRTVPLVLGGERSGDW